MRKVWPYSTSPTSATLASIRKEHLSIRQIVVLQAVDRDAVECLDFLETKRRLRVGQVLY
jgi:hypothetical protein